MVLNEERLKRQLEPQNMVNECTKLKKQITDADQLTKSLFKSVRQSIKNILIADNYIESVHEATTTDDPFKSLENLLVFNDKMFGNSENDDDAGNEEEEHVMDYDNEYNREDLELNVRESQDEDERQNQDEECDGLLPGV
ncbi:unnamed protein product [Ambrosiozyma monospora]|uniref:Unnamed protein product n=1 Tax=Ambrosiozyma monospora TaxID=43982 RepID=A0ACB5SR54_AMBMO|nr:unnamed protein product [Ambrosiozyma monospora]